MTIIEHHDLNGKSIDNTIQKKKLKFLNTIILVINIRIYNTLENYNNIHTRRILK